MAFHRWCITLVAAGDRSPVDSLHRNSSHMHYDMRWLVPFTRLSSAGMAGTPADEGQTPPEGLMPRQEAGIATADLGDVLHVSIMQKSLKRCVNEYAPNSPAHTVCAFVGSGQRKTRKKAKVNV